MKLKLFVLLSALLSSAALFASGYSTVKVVPSKEADELEYKAISVFQRNILSKTEPLGPGKELVICLRRDPSLASESFEISKSGKKYVVTAADGRGLLFGLGKMIHCSSFDDGFFFPGDVCGSDAPEKPVRGIYFATHFGNYYESAPVDEVCAYVEDLALWGYNAVEVWFDMHQYTGIDDPQAVKMIARLAEIFKAGRSVGMKSCITMIANEGYCNTPDSLRAKKIDFTGFYGCEICPSVPGGVELIVRNREGMADAFANMGIPFDMVCVWPYDQGGCTCEACSPWGGNGFVRLSKELARVLKAKFPSAKVVLSTWCFDYGNHDKGEWRGLADAFSKEEPWVDYILADSHKEFPRYLLSNPVPGGLPLLNFPEISMYRNYPWGGYGSNPMPRHYHTIYSEAAPLLQGGFPYSEGLFEDFNKALYAQMYWNSALTPEEMTRRYVSSEFSGRYADEIVDAIFTLEKNQGAGARYVSNTDHTPVYVKLPEEDFGAAQTFETLDRINARLPRNVRESKRWMLVHLRSKADSELRKSEGKFTSATNAIFLELLRLSHLENAYYYLYPPYVAPYSGTALTDMSRQFNVKDSKVEKAR